MVGWPHRESRAWIYGHRGVRAGVPENTLLAFEQALNLGADGIEFDVQNCRNSVPVVFHDPTLDRMTMGADQRRVADTIAHDLCAVPLGQGTTIPRFSEVLKWANAKTLYLNVELKSTGLDALSLVAAVEQEISVHANDSLKSRLLFSSFAVQIIDSARERRWPWPLAQLLGAEDVLPVGLGGFDNCGIHAHYSLLGDETLGQLANRQTFVNAWTVNTANEVRRLAKGNIDGIITDEPGIARNALG